MKIHKAFLMYLMLATPFMTLSCSTTDEEGMEEEVIQEEEQQEEDEQDQEENGEDMENMENAGFNNAANNQFFNNAGNQALNDQPADQLNNQGLQGEGELQQIMEEMNNVNGQMGGQDLNQGFNNLLAQDQMGQPMNNQMLDNQGMMQQNMGNDMMGQNQNFLQQQNMQMEDMQQNMQMEGVQNMQMDGMQQQQTMATTGSPLAPGLPELGSKMSYIVQRGDTLAKIATKIYGEPSKWTEIADFTGIANPRLIYPGDVVYYQLTDQTRTFASAYESVTRSEVKVQQGDTLSTIASRVLGSAGNWKLIWRHNDTIANPDKLVAGSVLYYVSPSSLADSFSESSEKIVENDSLNDIEKPVKSFEMIDSSIQDSVNMDQVVEISHSIDHDFAELDKINVGYAPVI